MPLVSIRLPDEIETRLAQEAERRHRPKSEIAREAISDYLDRLERERFLDEIARAARAQSGEEALSVAGEALELDNEALSSLEAPGVGEKRGGYRKKKKKKKR